MLEYIIQRYSTSSSTCFNYYFKQIHKGLKHWGGWGGGEKTLYIQMMNKDCLRVQVCVYTVGCRSRRGGIQGSLQQPPATSRQCSRGQTGAGEMRERPAASKPEWGGDGGGVAESNPIYILYIAKTNREERREKADVGEAFLRDEQKWKRETKTTGRLCTQTFKH